ncbi:MAG TPA: acetyl/propionyl/methylcrotonyl-CoA carboxylase subunit alpha [Rhizomicrobium sp.]|jgi:acetyl-CoA carboxylase biotin carboxylase subunit|nr:acetyl/propionyl/methylcrotonyl-CoA carboxylase subunit alpha [Rhizomicrobium sp.]
MFSKLLIANRGEIAVRVMRTAKRLGVSTVAVCSDADAHALHVAMADEAVRIGPPPVRESYLKADAILAAARQTGAEAIHPGYGFLSENAEFAEACAAAGIVFVGPPPSAIRAMGLKDRAKALMAEAGVPVVPGYLGEDQSPKRLAEEADRTGYPVLIKAVAGGGGKGMRRVDANGEFASALEGARREAASAFGDDRVLIEKYVTRPRHIEMQVFADKHGNAMHLFERDCSLQRRHQKVIEEAPAPGMPPAMRARMGEAAVKAAQAVGYSGAGTVEFIADASEGLKADRFWFMEMNTRLQVEHPVTEAITGLDLVEWQLRVASDEKLPLAQDAIRLNGHAVEARLYAEDPQHDFLPSTGALERLHLPENMVRVDSGVREGDAVTPFYDPMIAKVIAHADTRDAAAAKLAHALEEAQIAGLRSNNAFLIRALKHPDFITGEIDTGFIPRHQAELIPPKSDPPDHVLAQAALFLVQERERAHRSTDPWDRDDGFRLVGDAGETIDFMVSGNRKSVQLIHRRGGGLDVVGERTVTATHVNAVQLKSGDIAVFDHGETWTLPIYDPFAAADEQGGAADRITAPMPGKVIQVLVRPGETVKRGQPLAVLEAMKMEHTLSASADALVATVDVSPGDQVNEGAVIVRFAKEKSEAA